MTKTTNRKLVNYVVIDTETTGLKPGKDEIIEISAYKVKGGSIVDKFSELVKPSQPIPKSATKINGITDDMVAGCRSIDAVLPDFLSFVGSAPIVGQNVTFDVRFINAVRGEDLTNTLVDTMRVSRLVNKGMDNHKLNTIYQRCLDEGMKPVEETGEAHRALYDVAVTHAVYEHMKGSITSANEEKYSQLPEECYRRAPRNTEHTENVEVVSIDAEAIPVTEAKPKKHKTWLWVLGWLFIFPVPLTVLMLNNERTRGIKKGARIAITITGWLVYLVLVFGRSQ